MMDWRRRWEGEVCTPEDMVRFVDAVGCSTAQPLPRYPDFPSQAEVLGNLPPGTVDVWFWKDDLHIQKRFYYTRVFGGNPGFVSLKLLPALVATNGMVVDEMLYCGILSAEARQVYDLIEAEGPIPTRDLKTRLTPDARSAATRELHHLERHFIITKTDITGRTLGTYGYVWDLVERWMPEVLEAADALGRGNAEALLNEHFSQFGIAANSPFHARVLGWKE